MRYKSCCCQMFRNETSFNFSLFPSVQWVKGPHPNFERAEIMKWLGMKIFIHNQIREDGDLRSSSKLWSEFVPGSQRESPVIFTSLETLLQAHFTPVSEQAFPLLAVILSHELATSLSAFGALVHKVEVKNWSWSLSTALHISCVRSQTYAAELKKLVDPGFADKSELSLGQLLSGNLEEDAFA